MSPSLKQWLKVTFDQEKITISVLPPYPDPWTEDIPWKDIVRVGYEFSGLMTSDHIYLYASTRPESYEIPIEASGGQDLWGEIINRGLFDAGQAIQIMLKGEGLHFWPPPTAEEIEQIKAKLATKQDEAPSL